VQKFVTVNQFFVVVNDHLFDVVFDFFIKYLGQGFARPRPIKLYQPHVYVLELVLHDVCVVTYKELVDRTHNEGEEKNADLLYEHIVQVFFIREPLHISVSNGRQGGNHPVESSDVLGLGV